MPTCGNKLYNVFNAVLETVIFLQEQTLKGATLPTWTMINEDGKKFIANSNMYCVTEREAWEREMTILDSAMKGLPREVQALQEHIAVIIEQFYKVQGELRKLT